MSVTFLKYDVLLILNIRTVEISHASANVCHSSSNAFQHTTHEAAFKLDECRYFVIYHPSFFKVVYLSKHSVL